MENVLTQEHRGGEALLSKIEIINEREGGLIEAMVPVDTIDRNEVAVNEFHVRELVDSMLTESEKGIANGQLTPILLGQVNGRQDFSIIDGFHRDAAIKRSGKDTVFATIRLNTTPEEIDDLRILTANSHSSVAFSRIVDWVGTAWSRTEWAQTITAAQAFSLANQKAMTGARIGLTEEAAKEIRAWALDKCERWRIAPATIYTSMATAQIADPELVATARTRDSGHRLDQLTPDHLKYIARAYPNMNREQQNVANIVTGNNLTIQETKQVLDILGSVEHDEQITEILELTDWHKMLDKDENVIRRKRKPIEIAHTPETREPIVRSKRVVRKIAKNNNTPESANRDFNKVLQALSFSQIQLAKLSIRNLMLSGLYTPVRAQEQSHSPIKAIGVPDNFAEALLVDTTRIPDTLRLVFDELKSPLTKSAEVTASIDSDTADYVVNEAYHRLLTDAQTGPLRFALPNKKESVQNLLINAINDEVAQLKEVKSIIIKDAAPLEVPFAEILTAMPAVRPAGRVGLALFSMMDAPQFAVKQVLHMNDVDADALKKSLIERFQ